MSDAQAFPHKVEVLEDLRDLIPVFLKNRERELECLKDHLGSKNFDAISQVGHKMKGTCGGYGFVYISHIGKSLEIAGEEKNTDKIQELLKELEVHLNQLEVSYVEEEV